jgi:hypothetical protein
MSTVPEPTPTPPAPTPTPAPTPAPAPPVPQPPIDPEKGFEKALARHQGDSQKLSRRLYMDSYKDRERIRELEGKVPPEGSVVLTGDELKAFQDLKKLGKKPEEIHAALTEHAELKSADARRVTEATRKEFADLVGFDAEVLGKLLDDEDIEIEIQEPVGPNGQPQRGRDGKPYRVPMVKTEDPKDKRKSLFTALPDYAAKHWAKFLPALKPNGAPKLPNGTPTPREPAPPPRSPVPGGGPTMYTRKNPF